MYKDDDDEPLCWRDEDDLEEGDFEDKDITDGGTGCKYKVREFRDGSTTYKFGGPCGSVSYDKWGREC